MPDDVPGDPHLAALEDLTRVLLEEASLEQLLDQLLELTSRALATCTAVSVTVVEDDGSYVTVAHTDERVASLDALQYELGQGPCVEALDRAEEQDSADLAADARWPVVAERAAQLGLHSVLALPLLVEDRCIGALNVFHGEVGGIGPADQQLARRIAAPAATTLANARAYRRVSRLAVQLQEALASRAVIERAKGVIMAREGCDEEAAFQLLRRASQDHNRKLRDVARAVVDATAGRAEAGRDG